jgi:hypothetical protein
MKIEIIVYSRYHILTVLKVILEAQFIVIHFSDSLRYILIVFLSCKSKEEPMASVKYMQFNGTHLKVFKTPIVFQLNKKFNRYKSSF